MKKKSIIRKTTAQKMVSLFKTLTRSLYGVIYADHSRGYLLEDGRKNIKSERNRISHGGSIPMDLREIVNKPIRRPKK